MSARIFDLQRESQVNLDSVFPDLRAKFSNDPIYVESDLFEALKETHGLELKSEIANALKYFFEENGPYASLQGDGIEGCLEYFLDDSVDERDQRYHMILLRKSDD